MNLIQIDDVDLQTPEARFALTANRIALQTLTNLAFFIPDALTFCKDVRTVRASFDGARHHVFRIAEPIDGSSINPIEAAIESRVNCRFGEAPRKSARGLNQFVCCDLPRRAGRYNNLNLLAIGDVRRRSAR